MLSKLSAPELTPEGPQTVVADSMVCPCGFAKPDMASQNEAVISFGLTVIEPIEIVNCVVLRSSVWLRKTPELKEHILVWNIGFTGKLSFIVFVPLKDNFSVNPIFQINDDMSRDFNLLYLE